MLIELSIVNAVNLFMIAAGFGICLLSIIQISKAPIEKQVKGYFIVFLWIVIIYIMMNLTRIMLEGHMEAGIEIAIRTATFIDFLMSGVLVFLLSVMIIYTALPGKGSRSIMIALLLILAVHTVMLVISSYTDLYYYIDANNHYHRSKLYILSNICPMLMMMQDAYFLVKFRDKFEKRVRIAFWIYLLAPLAAILLQTALPEVRFIIFATVGAAVNMFAVITNDLRDKFEKQQLEASRLDTELSMATRIQADMLPSIFPAFPERDEFDIYATMTPAKEVGGDFYDFFLIDEDHLGIVMADVSGKGVPAALFMMASKILVQNYATVKKDPKAALEAANNQICQSNHEEMFVTVWLGILDIKTGVLTASNAGHEFPALKMPGGGFKLYKDKHGFVVGGMEGVKYSSYQVRLEKGSMLFLYTDGVAEATNASDELFGTERLINALNADTLEDPQKVLECVRKAVDGFVGEAPQFDDLTMLCIKYNG